MKDIYETLEYRNKKYKIVFNLNVMQQIQDEYGTIEAWGDLTSPKKDDKEGEPNAKAVIFGFWAMLNEGIDIENDEKAEGEKIAPLTLKQVGRILTEVGINGAASRMADVVVKSTQTADDAKNA